MNCAVCDKQKAELHKKISAILPKTEYLICNECQEKGHEPRYLVALAYRANMEAAKKFVVNHLYPGEEIKLREVVG